MAFVEVRCTECDGVEVVKYGKSGTGEQRYLCRRAVCRKTFQLAHRYKACDQGKLEKLLSSKAEQQPILLLPITLELDEQWSFVCGKSNQRWLWLALNHYTSEILAYTFGDRTDKTCKQLQHLMEPFNITQYFTDGLGAYQRILPFEQHEEGKRNTQKIERKFLTFRTRIKRLARKTICFSKSEFMHDTVIGLFINRFEFGRKV